MDLSCWITGSSGRLSCFLDLLNSCLSGSWAQCYYIRSVQCTLLSYPIQWRFSALGVSLDDPRNCENQLFYCLRPASMVAASGFVRISGTQCTVAWVQHYRYYRYSAIIQSLLVQRIRRWPCDNSVHQLPGLLGPKWGCSGIINLRIATKAVLGLQLYSGRCSEDRARACTYS